MKRIPAIKAVMTPFPYSVETDDTMENALNFMQEKDFHHLPVTRDGRLIGLISSADIESWRRERGGADPGKARVEAIALREAHVFDLNERLDIVLEAMSKQHIEAVIVTRNGRLAGVFTMTDVCIRFAEYLREQFRPHGGGEAA